MPKQHWQFSIVIPVYNEQENLAPLAKEIEQSLADYDYEIIFVDDGSTDDTQRHLLSLMTQNPRVRMQCHRRNYGQSAALLTGVRAACFPWIVTLDGDFQNDPKDIPTLLNALSGPDQFSHFVVGLRQKRNDHWIRKLSSRVGNGIRQIILRDQCPDTGCSLKCFPKTVFLNCPHFNHMHRFLPALFQRAGLTMCMVPVNHRPRIHGVSKYGIRNRLFVGLVDLLGMIWLIRRPCHPQTSEDYDNTPS